MKFEPVTVTATLQDGIAHATPWGISLDGILASEVHYRRKAELHAAGQEHTPLVEQEEPEDLPLPLARCGQGEQWHWAATCSWPVDGQGLLPDVRQWMSQVDHRAVTDVVDDSLQAVIDDKRGRYRAHLMPLLVTSTTAVTWSCVGDPEAIRSLLEPVQAIGKKRAAGNGHVLRWEVAPAPGLDAWAAGHLHPDGTLGRPCPPSCLEKATTPVAGLEELATGRTGIRPPLVHPARQVEQLLPQR